MRVEALSPGAGTELTAVLLSGPELHRKGLHTNSQLLFELSRHPLSRHRRSVMIMRRVVMRRTGPGVVPVWLPAAGQMHTQR